MLLQVQYIGTYEVTFTSQCTYIEGTTNINGYNVIFVAQPGDYMDVPITFICAQ
jgi:predicted RNA-binding protein with TRAM domain